MNKAPVRFGWRARIGLLLAIVACGGSCATQEAGEEKSGDEAPRQVENRRLVGRVASVPSGRSFVLIQIYGSWQVPPGSVVTSEGGDGRAANLLATGERRGQFAAADVRSGEVEVGDAVYFRPLEPLGPAEEEETEALEEGEAAGAAEGWEAENSGDT